ncbi:hypothetical protein P7C73_g2923, partial [Tremellales sp. Uapishka_1]
IKSPPPSRPSSPGPSSPNPSFLSADPMETASVSSDLTMAIQSEGFHVTAYTVSKAIRYTEVHKALAKAIKANVRNELSRLPDKIVERVAKLVAIGICPTASSSGVGSDLLKSHHGLGSEGETGYRLDFGDPNGTGERLQDFMEGVYDDLITHYRSTELVPGEPKLLRKTSASHSWGRGPTETEENAEEKRERKEKERKEKEELAEKEASDGTERVEGVVCKLLYNRHV